MLRPAPTAPTRPSRTGRSVRVSTLWPSAFQERLLHVVLGTDETALDAWDQLTSADAFNCDHLNDGEYRLLPAIWKRLHALGVTHPLMPRLRGVYRQTWFTNQMHLDTCRQVIARFQAHGIAQTLVTKGLALSLFYYRDLGLRPMEDIDLQVRPAEAEKARRVLLSDGWRTRSRRSNVGVRHAEEFRRGDTEALDLHWYGTRAEGHATGSALTWDTAQHGRWKNEQFLAPDAAELFIQTCVHGLHPNVVASLRWLVDARQILDVEGDDLGDRIADLAERRRVVGLVQAGVDYLRSTFADPGDRVEAVWQSVSRRRVRPFERRELKLLTRWGETGRPRAISLKLCGYRRQSDSEITLVQMMGFPKYYWNLLGRPSIGQVMRRAFARLSRRIAS